MEQKKGRQSGRSIKYTWFISYMLILAVPLLTGLWLCWQMQYRINEERVAKSSLQTTGIIQHVEMDVIKSANIVSYFKRNALMQEAIERADETLYAKTALYESQRREIIQYKTSYNVSESIYMYFKSDNVIVSTGGCKCPLNFTGSIT